MMNGSKRRKKSVGLEEAIKIVDEKSTSLIWLGVEPGIRISNIMNVNRDRITRMDPEELIYKDSDQLKNLENHIFVCYHGRTSKFISEFLEKKHNINTYHLKDGIASFTDELF